MEKTVPTPHIEAKEGDFAKTVLMSGDPLRAKMVAEQFLSQTKLVNGVRGALGFSGKFKGNPVSVMTSGMGMPSMGIYSYELFNFYNVENIIRIGTCGGIGKEIKLKEVVFALSACTDSAYLKQFELNGDFAPACSFNLLQKAIQSADELGKPFKVGSVLTTDTFYGQLSHLSSWAKMGILGVEMETAALYANALRAQKNALSILTVSDLPFEDIALSSHERQNTFLDMVEIALNTSLKC